MRYELLPRRGRGRHGPVITRQLTADERRYLERVHEETQGIYTPFNGIEIVTYNNGKVKAVLRIEDPER